MRMKSIEVKNPKKELSFKIREARIKRGWTQEYLAKITGLSRIYIIKIEAGQIPNPGIENAKKLCYALGLKIEEL